MKVTIYQIAGIISFALLLACGNTKNSMDVIKDFSTHPSDKEADFSMIASDSSWKVSFISGKELVFTDVTTKKQFKVANPEEQLAAGANILTVLGKQDDVELKLVIDIATCRSGGLKSTVHYDGKTVEGCGHYQGHANLFTEWQPIELNGKPVKMELFQNKQPILRFNHEEGMISGNGGCNNFSGKVTFNYKSFNSEGIIATKMYCEPESKFETTLLQILGHKKVHYSFQKDMQHLFIETTEGSVLFKKVSQL